MAAAVLPASRLGWLVPAAPPVSLARVDDRDGGCTSPSGHEGDFSQVHSLFKELPEEPFTKGMRLSSWVSEK